MLEFRERNGMFGCVVSSWLVIWMLVDQGLLLTAQSLCRVDPGMCHPLAVVFFFLFWIHFFHVFDKLKKKNAPSLKCWRWLAILHPSFFARMRIAPMFSMEAFEHSKRSRDMTQSIWNASTDPFSHTWRCLLFNAACTWCVTGYGSPVWARTQYRWRYPLLLLRPLVLLLAAGTHRLLLGL